MPPVKRIQINDRAFSRWLSINPVAVEKLFRAKIGKNKIASECVISDVLKFRDISYPGFSPFSDEKGLFQHPRDISTTTVGLAVSRRSARAFA